MDCTACKIFIPCVANGSIKQEAAAKGMNEGSPQVMRYQHRPVKDVALAAGWSTASMEPRRPSMVRDLRGAPGTRTTDPRARCSLWTWRGGIWLARAML